MSVHTLIVLDLYVSHTIPVTIQACPRPEDRKIAALKRYAQEFARKQETLEEDTVEIARLVSNTMHTSGIYAGIA
jgi:hypothetical protein